MNVCVRVCDVDVDVDVGDDGSEDWSSPLVIHNFSLFFL
jgi:hypothetical protein